MFKFSKKGPINENKINETNKKKKPGVDPL